MRTWSAVMGVLLLASGCSSSPSAPSPTQPDTPSPTQPNTAPTVSIVFVGPATCSPLPGKPCVLTVAAVAADPEGPALSYRWSGCATGSAPQAQCLVDTLGELPVSVEVTDKGGLSARAETRAEGTNQVPQFGISYTWVSPSGGSVEFLGWVRDPDEGDLWGSRYCVSASATGACTNASLRCPSSGPELVLLRAAPAGMCAVTIQVSDSWNAVGSWLLTFDINTPSNASIAPTGP